MRKIEHQMNDAIIDEISLAFYNLAQVNTMVYDYWVTELYDEEGNMISERWNEQTLKMMETDVMYNSKWLNLLYHHWSQQHLQFMKNDWMFCVLTL